MLKQALLPETLALRVTQASAHEKGMHCCMPSESF
jgi:hypothetical protein